MFWFNCIFGYVGAAIISLMGFLYLGRFYFDFGFKRGADNLQQVLMLRRHLRRTRRAYCLPFNKELVRSEGGMVSVRYMLSMSATYIQPQAATPVLFIQSDALKPAKQSFISLGFCCFIFNFFYICLCCFRFNHFRFSNEG